MRVISLIELLLVVFTFYAIFEGGMKVLVPVLCLTVVFLSERLKTKLKEDKQFRKKFFSQYLHEHDKNDTLQK